MTHILWSGRMAGWLSPSGNYISVLKDARIFSYEEAIEYCVVHYKNGFAEFGLLPIALEDLDKIKADANVKR